LITFLKYHVLKIASIWIQTWRLEPIILPITPQPPPSYYLNELTPV